MSNIDLEDDSYSDTSGSEEEKNSGEENEENEDMSEEHKEQFQNIVVDTMDEDSKLFNAPSGSTNTGFMHACLNGFDRIALKMLEYPDKCRLDYINPEDDSTALMTACCKGLVEVVKKIFEYPDKCNRSHVSTDGDNALILLAASSASDSETLDLLQYFSEEDANTL